MASWGRRREQPVAGDFCHSVLVSTEAQHQVHFQRCGGLRHLIFHQCTPQCGIFGELTSVRNMEAKEWGSLFYAVGGPVITPSASVPGVSEPNTVAPFRNIFLFRTCFLRAYNTSHTPSTKLTRLSSICRRTQSPCHIQRSNQRITTCDIHNRVWLVANSPVVRSPLTTPPNTFQYLASIPSFPS